MKSSKSFPPRASKLDATNLQNKEFFTTKETWSQQKSVLSIKEDNTRQSRKWIFWRWCCKNHEKAEMLAISHVVQNWVASIKSVTNILHSTKYVTKCHKKRRKTTNGEVVVGATGGGGLSTSRRRRSADRRLGSEQPLNEETHHSNLGAGLGKLVHVSIWRPLSISGMKLSNGDLQTWNLSWPSRPTVV